MVFTSVLAATMAASTFMLLVFGVFADQLIAEFGVERWQVGLLVTAASGFSALLSPPIGHVTDRLGARRTTVLTLLGASVALAAVGLAPTYVLLFVAASATALPQAMANPATNKLIAEHVRIGSRGVVTGIKQSGVQVGVFVGGIALPLIADPFGWRVAVLVFAVAWLAAGVVGALTLPPDPVAVPPSTTPPTPTPASASDEAGVTTDGAGPGPLPVGVGPPRRTSTRLPALVRRVTVYGFLLGAGGSTLFTYIPLYAEEVVGVSPRVAGLVVSLTGLTGVAARIGWGRAAELQLGALRSLRWIAVIALLPPLFLLAAGGGSAAFLWPAAVTTGLSASAWNAVGMLAIIQGLPSSETGRASGLVMFGFLAGLGLGAPAFGWTVDLTGSYVVGWSAAAVVFATSLLVLARAEEPSHTDPRAAAAPSGDAPGSR